MSFDHFDAPMILKADWTLMTAECSFGRQGMQYQLFAHMLHSTARNIHLNHQIFMEKREIVRQTAHPEVLKRPATV
jgi:hypothetical protein